MARMGRPPRAPETVQSEVLPGPRTVRVRPAVADAIQRRALRERKSVAAVVRDILEAFAAREFPYQTHCPA